MAFAAVITNKMLLPPAQKRSPDSGNLYIVWGTYTNGAGDTGGEIETEGSRVLFANATDETGANAVQTSINDSADGLITITTTAGDDGEWFAVVKQ